MISRHRLLLCASAIAAASCGGSANSPTAPTTTTTLTPPPGATAAMVSEGATLYLGSCQTCHGPGGRNGPYGPDLTDNVYLHNSGGFEEIVAVITTGVLPSQFKSSSSQAAFFMQPKGGMNLTDAQVRALAAYVWALSHSR